MQITMSMEEYEDLKHEHDIEIFRLREEVKKLTKESEEMASQLCILIKQLNEYKKIYGDLDREKEPIVKKSAKKGGFLF